MIRNKRYFSHRPKFKIKKKEEKKGTYFKKAAMFPFKGSEAFSKFIDLEQT